MWPEPAVTQSAVWSLCTSENKAIERFAQRSRVISSQFELIKLAITFRRFGIMKNQVSGRDTRSKMMRMVEIISVITD